MKTTVAFVLSAPLVAGFLIELLRLFAWVWVYSSAALLIIATGMILTRRLLLPYANPRVISTGTRERPQRSR